jgi:hypothetical protein
MTSSGVRFDFVIRHSTFGIRHSSLPCFPCEYGLRAMEAPLAK